LEKSLKICGVLKLKFLFLLNMFSKKDLIFAVPDPIQWAGKFGKKVLVIWVEEIPSSANRSFLEKMLSAVQVDLEKECHYAVLRKDETAALIPYIKEKQPNQVLVFGLSPAPLGLHFEQYLYQPVFFYQTWFLFADELAKLEPDRQLKSQLWNHLKHIFSVENK
jgi:hypothetical protein